ncbi:hypothetical protein Ancab_010430 [Ancistrocladus abbreviatus]
MDNAKNLHVVMLPWLAMGHLIPFLHLSKRLAQKGLQVSYLSTPKNITTLQNLLPPPTTTTTTTTTATINLVSIPFPENKLLNDAECSMEIGNSQQAYLKSAFDSLQGPVAEFLRNNKPHWIIYDFSCHWVPPVARELGISCVFLSLFNASTMCYVGPPTTYLARSQNRKTAEEMAAPPTWMPSNSNITYRVHEVKKFLAHRNKSYLTDGDRFAGAITGANFVAIRTSPELESDWIELLAKLYEKTVVPIGYLFPGSGKGSEDAGNEDEEEGKWREIKEWLDNQRVDSVIYVALGTEAALSPEELSELAHGLEESGMSFLWVLRNLPQSTEDVFEMLPEGFKERVEGRGFVYTGWAPQVKILGHASVRGFLNHCGWNSVIEGLGFGRVLVLLPFVNDQGLVARLLEGLKLGVEVQRSELDGSFASDSVAESVRLVIMESEGGELRKNARSMRNVIGDEELNNRYVETFISYLRESRN